MITVERPTVKIKPGKAGKLRFGAPWAYADQIAMDRRTRALEPGTIVRLLEDTRELGTFAFNPESQIAARLLDREATASIDAAWLRARLKQALALREALFDAPFYRLVHAEGDGLPGLIVDRFGDALVVQPNAAWLDRLLEPLFDVLRDITGCSTIVLNGTSRGRVLEGLEERLEVVSGQLDGPLEVPMNGAIYLADLIDGQKTGLFFDQRPNHAFVAGLAKDADILDVFSHVGGFSLAALAAGAKHALAIDSSAPALQLAEAGAKRSGSAERLRTEKADAFDALAGLARDGARFDIVVCDPPAFAPRKSALEKGLRAYERLARLAAPLVNPGGWLVLCSCSHAALPELFQSANTTGIGKSGRGGQLVWSGRAGPDHPSHLSLPETSYLKVMCYRLDG